MAKTDPMGRMLKGLRSMRWLRGPKPLRLRFSRTATLTKSITEVLDQIRDRDNRASGSPQLDMVLKALVGAKLRLSFPELAINAQELSVADSNSHRDADFLVGEMAIHVTTLPGERVMRRCEVNIERGLRPLIVTLRQRLNMAEVQATDLSILDRIELFDVDHFVSLSIQVQSGFAREREESTVAQLTAEYNSIIDMCDADPSLRIRM